MLLAVAALAIPCSHIFACLSMGVMGSVVNDVDAPDPCSRNMVVVVLLASASLLLLLPCHASDKKGLLVTYWVSLFYGSDQLGLGRV